MGEACACLLAMRASVYDAMTCVTTFRIECKMGGIYQMVVYIYIFIVMITKTDVLLLLRWMPVCHSMMAVYVG